MGNTLNESATELIKERQRWLKDEVLWRKKWLVEAKQAHVAVQLLPEAVLSYDNCSVNVDVSTYRKKLTIYYHLPKEDKTETLAEIMSLWAKQGLQWNQNAELNSERDEEFHLEGTKDISLTEGINGINVTIMNMDKPPTCRLVKKTEIETREVTKFEAICDEMAEVEG